MENNLQFFKTTGKYAYECERLESFQDWPFTENCNCLPQALAEAGFYHCPSDNEPDLVRCFVCFKELDGWEPDDNPWDEHRSHTTNCPFVKLDKKEEQQSLREWMSLNLQNQINSEKMKKEKALTILNEKKEEYLKQLCAATKKV